MAQQQAPQQLGQETVALSLLTRRAAESAYTDLKELCEAASGEQSDTERKIGLLKFINKTRQRLLRLYAVCKWSRQIPLVERCQQLVGTLSNHELSFTQAADSLFYLHESLQQSRAPMYDVPSAMDVLLTGGFHRMPKCIEDLNGQQMLEGVKQEAALEKLDTVLRSKLLDIAIPREYTSVSVHRGRVTFLVEGEFSVQLTLGYRGNPSLWRVLQLELLVGESSSKGTFKFTEMQRMAVSDDLERRMSILDNPFGIVYSVLHEFCAALVMDTLCRQVRDLRRDRWKDAIRLDLSYDGGQSATGEQPDAETETKTSRVFGLKITYWLDLPKSGGETPSLRIERGTDQRIFCQHIPPVTDPYTNNEAEFALNQDCLDVQSLILRAIKCNIHSRLVEVQRSLKNNSSIYRAEGDVFLKSYTAQDTMEGEDKLYVRAYAGIYITLGINIWNGRFMLQAPNLLASSVIKEMEGALNQGTMQPVDVFINLRNESIIHHFSSIASSANLKVHDGAINLKFPDGGPKLGSALLLMGFPHSGDLYYLALHLDQDFMPHFVLLEKNQGSNLSRQIVIKRFMILDIEKSFLTADDVTLSLLSEQQLDVGKDKLNEVKPVLSFQTKAGFMPTSRSPKILSSPSMSLGSPPARTVNQPVSGKFVARRSSSTNNLSALGNISSPIRSNRPSPSNVPRNMPSPSNLQRNIPSPSPKISEMDLDDDRLSKLIDSISTGAENSNLRQPRMVKSASKSSLHQSSPKQMLSPSRSKRKLDTDILSIVQHISKKTKTESKGTLNSLVGQTYASICAAVNQGKAPLVSYLAVLLHVVSKCLLIIKFARLTNQMTSLGICYNKEYSSSGITVFKLASSSLGGDMGKFCNAWRRMHLNYVKDGSDGWEIHVRDKHYRSLWSLQKQEVTEWGAGVQFAALSEADAHIKCSADGLTLSYNTVEDDSIKKVVMDLERLRSARAFALCMKQLLEEDVQRPDGKWRGFKIEAVGLTSVSFSYTGNMQGVIARFVVEWTSGRKHCTVHVSPEQLFPNTMYLQEYIDMGTVGLLLDAIRITIGPLQALAGAIRPARMTTAVPGTTNIPPGKSSAPGNASPPSLRATPSQVSTITSSPGRGPGPGIVPSSLLPTDISVLMRGPYWVRIIYRKQFSVDMRCFEGDQVWLQPSPPPPGSAGEAGGWLPCPQFRPFVMENVAVGLNSPETAAGGNHPTGQQNGTSTSMQQGSGNRVTTRTVSQKIVNTQSSLSGISLLPGRNLVVGGPAGVYPGYRGELNSAFCGMSDDGGYGGAWVPLAALKKVLRSTLKYLGVLWLFAQFPNIIRDVLGSIKDGTLLHLDSEQPALRFNIGNCMFAVNMHRHQLYLQGVNVKKFQQQPHQLQSNQAAGAEPDLTIAEMGEIAEFFGRRVAAEPYDASRLASFVTILTLPVAVLRDFLGLISWKKEAQKNQATENLFRPKIELCLENRPVINPVVKEEGGSASSSVKSSILHDREKAIMEFTLCVSFDLSCLAQVNVNVAGGAGWLPQCVLVRARYYYGEGRLLMVNMEGSHGGKACWSRGDEWDRLKDRTAKSIESAVSATQESNARLRVVAETVQLTVQSALQQLRTV